MTAMFLRLWVGNGGGSRPRRRRTANVASFRCHACCIFVHVATWESKGGAVRQEVALEVLRNASRLLLMSVGAMGLWRLGPRPPERSPAASAPHSSGPQRPAEGSSTNSITRSAPAPAVPWHGSELASVDFKPGGLESP